MELDQVIVENIIEEIDKYEHIALLTHRNADGDTLGSALALYEFLRFKNKEVSIFNPGTIADVFRFMKPVHVIKQNFNPLDFDLIIAVDCATSKMTGLIDTYPELFKNTQPFINIDHHHTCNDLFGTINLVLDAPSTTVIIYQLFQDSQVILTPNMATNLLTGLLTDTGCFMHSNTNPVSYRIGSRLLSRGADLYTITQEMFLKKKLSTLKLWGKVLENIYVDDDGVCLVAVTNEDFEKSNANYDDLSGIVDYINSVPGTKLSMVLTEKGKNVKGSLRTQTELDVSKIASKFGGGGHKKASGFVMPGRLKKRTIWEIEGS